MAERADIVVIGAGPAGMAAAVAAAEAGCAVVTLDDQPAPGGQVWRNVEAVAERGDLAIMGRDYARGVAAVAAFRRAAIAYRPGARVFGVEPAAAGDGGDVLFVRDGAAQRIACRRLIVATGAYERPAPFPGWTLPGVMSLGAGQIALKTGNATPMRPFVLAGQGPLLLSFAAQLRAAGSAPDLVLRLDDAGVRKRALGQGMKAALFGPDYLIKGARWAGALAGSVADVVEIAAEGDGRLERVVWRRGNGGTGAFDATTLLVHDGVVPNAQLTRAMQAPHSYEPRAAAWRPAADPATGRLDACGWVHVAGDCAGVNGWNAATAMGRLAAMAAVQALGKTAAGGLGARIDLARARAVRPFLDALYPPARAFRRPTDDVVACRCEDISVGDVRAAASLGAQGPNQLKAFTRAGMGPCQGRMCAQTVAGILAEAQARDLASVGLMRIRMPIAPVTIAEMAALDTSGIELPRT